MLVVDKWTLQNIKSSEIDTISWLDHTPISITVDDHQRGPPRIWRLNPTLLADKEICQELIQEHHAFFELNALPKTNTCTLWSTYKAYMRGIIIKLNKRLKNQTNRQIDEIMLQIENLGSKTKLILFTNYPVNLSWDRHSGHYTCTNMKTTLKTLKPTIMHSVTNQELYWLEQSKCNVWKLKSPLSSTPPLDNS